MNDELNGNFDRPIPKYVLCPDFVISKTDGDRHFISARQLAELYRVPMSECVIMPDMSDPRNRHWHKPQGAIELYPQYNGDYTLPPNVKVRGRPLLGDPSSPPG